MIASLNNFQCAIFLDEIVSPARRGGREFLDDVPPTKKLNRETMEKSSPNPFIQAGKKRWFYDDLPCLNQIQPPVQPSGTNPNSSCDIGHKSTMQPTEGQPLLSSFQKSIQKETINKQLPLIDDLMLKTLFDYLTVITHFTFLSFLNSTMTVKIDYQDKPR